AVMAGRSRGGAGGARSRYIYTGSNTASDPWRCVGCLAYFTAGLAAISGIMLTVFGSTGFFRTENQNNMFVFIGIACLLLSFVLISIGLFLTRRSPQQQLHLTPRITQPNSATF
uniref:Uncharacterized protein n=1 Tax=Plectus sambesii TaxID=2011161 RepID=A0A914V467_9BILA